jgi:hypothetical protein
MGGGRFNPTDWDQFKTVHSVAGKSPTQNFSSRAVADFDPATIVRRQSCETADKPQVTPVIIALDVTGSMGEIPNALIQGGLGTLMEQILARGSIPNPHVMFMAVGDVTCDGSPLQVTQFEADIRIADQLKKLYLEGGGGGNGSESYPIAWHFAATKTDLDCFKNRGEKGILFTIGDDNAPRGLSAAAIHRFMGVKPERDLSTAEILAQTQMMYEVFHLNLTQSSTCTRDVLANWNALLGERSMLVNDYTKLAEIIVSTIDLLRGRAKDEIIASWKGDSTQLVIAKALEKLEITPSATAGGVFRLPGAKAAKHRMGGSGL